MLTATENLNKFGIKNGIAYEAKIGFDKEGTACVKWYKIRGYRGAQIESLYRNEGRRTVFGVPVISIP